MNDTTHQGATAGHGPKRLVRTPDRKIAGVAAGIAHYLGIDPTIVRIAFVALAFAGGIGLLLYLICFFVMPKGEIDDRGPADPLDAYAILGIAGLVVGIGLLVGWHGLGGGARAVVAAGLIVGGILLLGRRLGPEGRGGDLPDGGHPVTPPSPPPSPAPAPPAPPDTTAVTAAPPSVSPLAATPYGPIPAQTTREAAPAASHVGVPVTGLALSVLAVAVAALLALGLSERVDLTLAGGLAIAVIVVGAGLAVASVTGGAPLLFLVGGLLTAGLLVTAATERFLDDGVGDRAYVAATADEIQPAYRLGIGDLRVDLSAVDLAGATRTVRVDLGIGHGRIVVPADVDLEVHGDVRAGSIVLPGEEDAGAVHVEGLDKTVDWSDDVADDSGRLVLDLDLTVGEVVVDRG